MKLASQLMKKTVGHPKWTEPSERERENQEKADDRGQHDQSKKAFSNDSSDGVAVGYRCNS